MYLKKYCFIIVKLLKNMSFTNISYNIKTLHDLNLKLKKNITVRKIYEMLCSKLYSYSLTAKASSVKYIC